MTKALATCALHFGKTLTEAEYEIYLRSLEEYESYRIVESIGRCARECSFMPKLKDILEKLPSKKVSNPGPQQGKKLIRTWVEPMSRTANVRYFEFEDNDRFVRIEPI